MKKVSVDQAECLAYGVCMMKHPELFDLPEDDETARVRRQPETDEEWATAEDAVASCPAGAISIQDE